VVYLPTDTVPDVLFFLNTDDTLTDIYIYMYGYTFLGSLWCSLVLMFVSVF
jgi:hypothetical protein